LSDAGTVTVNGIEKFLLVYFDTLGEAAAEDVEVREDSSPCPAPEDLLSVPR
jgi:hypothetical protein